VLTDRLCGGRKTSSFTLQWHLTNACENTCRHCYDRSDTTALPLEQNIAILYSYLTFAKKHALTPRISLSGGNPFLYPYFWELYEEICYRGIEVSILGNPINEHTLLRLLALRNPRYYQISLEGLEKTNDAIRGIGNFKRALDFLALAGKYGVAVAVMMTISALNVNEVLPLAVFLHGKVSRFSFNRLSSFGEGCALEPVPPKKYQRFLLEYLEYQKTCPKLSLKENLFSPILAMRGEKLSGGCTGYGCGAAFNFFALLPDGQVHACRKFPSPLGSILTSDFERLYFSKEAKKYRLAPEACRACKLAPNCRGCLAVVAGEGRDWRKEKDRYCLR
jgi:selenobiotic family peptide radical SAM maturase